MQDGRRGTAGCRRCIAGGGWDTNRSPQVTRLRPRRRTGRAFGDCHGRPPVRLRDEGPHQDLPRRSRRAERDLALLFAGRQDWRPGCKRVRQIDAVEDHGRAGSGLRRRGLGGGRRRSRLPAPGTRARSRQGRRRQRHGGPRRHQGASGALQRDQRPPRRAHGRRRDERAAGRAGGATGANRSRRRLGARPNRRDRHGRVALSPRRCRSGHLVRRRAAAGGAVPAASPAPRHPVARRTHQPPGCRVRGLAGTLPRLLRRHGHDRHPRPLFPRQRYGLDPRARPRPGKSPIGATTRPGWNRRKHASPTRTVGRPPAGAPSSTSWSGSGPVRGRARPRARPASPLTRTCWPRRRSGRREPPRSSSRRGRASATW